jgi:hypothetical protein
VSGGHSLAALRSWWLFTPEATATTKCHDHGRGHGHGDGHSRVGGQDRGLCLGRGRGGRGVGGAGECLVFRASPLPSPLLFLRSIFFPFPFRAPFPHWAFPRLGEPLLLVLPPSLSVFGGAGLSGFFGALAVGASFSKLLSSDLFLPRFPLWVFSSRSHWPLTALFAGFELFKLFRRVAQGPKHKAPPREGVPWDVLHSTIQPSKLKTKLVAAVFCRLG